MHVDAAILITEVMYNPDGSDSGNEWIELYNAGSETVTLTAGSSGWKINDGSNHNLVDPADGDGRGSLVVAPGAVFVIASNPSQFMASHAGSYTVIKSAISLPNSSATLSFLNNAGGVQDTVSYESSLGAADDGNSLHRSGNTFVAGSPTPGTMTESPPSTVQQQTTSTVESQSAVVQASAASGSVVPTMSVEIEYSGFAYVGVGTLFEAQAYSANGTPLISGVRYVWNFGDGSTAEGKRVFHTFSYPGTYIVLVSAGYNFSSSIARITVVTADAYVALFSEGDGSLLVRNTGSQEVDVGLWSVREGEHIFTIPEQTYIAAGQGIRFPPSITKLPGSTAAALHYPNGARARSAGVGANSPLRGEKVTFTAPTLSTAASFGGAGGSAEKESTAPERAPAVAAAANSEAAIPLWASFAGLLGVVGLGIAATMYTRRAGGSGGKETLPDADEFDIE